MAIFIGGNSTELEYNFSNKVSGSTKECPMKIYSNSVDIKNLPKPTDSNWKEITNQNFIDKLKTQDSDTVVETTKNEVLGNIINTNAPCDGMMNVEIGGNTLQNLINIKELSNITVKSENSFEAMLWAGTLLENSQVLNIFKPNTTYTLKVKYILKTTSDLQVYSPRIGFNLYSPNTGSFEFGQTYTLVKVDDVEYINITFTTPNNLEDKKLIFYTKRFTNETKVELGTVLVEDLMILEGDWTNYNLSYFEGIKSVGELEGNKIEVLSCGKNYINNDISAWDNGLTLATGYLSKTNNTGFAGKSIIYKINPMKSYSFSANGYTDTSGYQKRVILSFINDINNPTDMLLTKQLIFDTILTPTILKIENITPPPNAKYAFIYEIAQSSTLYFNNIQLEEGTTATPYEPYREDKLNILTTAPLRNLPNGVRDVVSGDVITRKIGKRAYEIGDENNSKVITDKINTYYELKTPVIENLPKQLTLQSFENGNLVINTSIPPFIKEWHSINKDDNGIMQYQSGTSGLNQALLVELDLNGLCDSFYNSDNNLLKNNLKELSMNAWMYGEGNNNGLVDYLCKIYYFQNNMWESRNKNNTNIPQKISEEKTKQDFPNLQITDDNKIYMLLLSNYPANDDIPSRLFLDYVDLRLKIDRQADIIQSTDISLNDEWSIFIKGFSPSWSSDNALIQNHTIFELKDKLILAYNRDEKVFYFEDLQAKIITKLPQFSFKSFQSINFIITQNRNRKITLYALPNSGGIQKVSSIGHNINEMCPIYLCQNSSNTNQSDAFIEDIQILHQTFVDKEIEVILKGRNEIDKDDDYYNKLAEIYKNPNIIPDFKNDKWSIHSNANVSDDGKTLTLNAVDKWETSFIKIPVLPNNRYILKANVSESDKYAYISFKQQHNDSVPLWSGDIGISKNENLFTTSYDCNNITIFCGSSQAGIFKFSDLELKRLD